MRFIHWILIAVSMGVQTAALAAFPEKPLRLIVPFPAGGAADMMARGMALRLGQELKQQVIIDNRGGAGGTPAAEAVAKAAPDGYTLFFGTMGTHAINPALYSKLRYDPLKDFSPISLTHTTARVLVVTASVPSKNINELIVLAKSKPGLLTYGSAGNGSSSHLSGALFESLAGVDMLHVPYKGSAPLLVDVLAGRIDMTFDSYSVYEEHIKSGKVRALGVTTKERMSAASHLPSISESGLTGYDVSNWLGVFAPAGTSKEVIDTLHAALTRAMATPELRQQLKAVGIEPTIGSPESFSQLIKSDLVKWAAIVKKTGATLD